MHFSHACISQSTRWNDPLSSKPIYESFVFRNTVDMWNVLYISLALERFVYYQQEPQNYEASAGLECACIHNNRTMNQWNHTASDRSPRTWANYKLNSFARYGSRMHELWDKLLKSNKPWMRRKRALSTRYTWLKFLKEGEFYHYFSSPGKKIKHHTNKNWIFQTTNRIKRNLPCDFL